MITAKALLYILRQSGCRHIGGSLGNTRAPPNGLVLNPEISAQLFRRLR